MVEIADVSVRVTIKEFGDVFQTCSRRGTVETREFKGSRDKMPIRPVKDHFGGEGGLFYFYASMYVYVRVLGLLKLTATQLRAAT